MPAPGRHCCPLVSCTGIRVGSFGVNTNKCMYNILVIITYNSCELYKLSLRMLILRGKMCLITKISTKYELTNKTDTYGDWSTTKFIFLIRVIHLFHN